MSILIPIADGSESLETVAIVNVLRRGDCDVHVASVSGNRQVQASRQILLTADACLDELPEQDYDAILLPGGAAGAETLGKTARLVEMLRAQRLAHRWFGGICAAPALALAPHGLLDGKQATCYPSFREHLLHWVDRPVVVDGHCITGQGPGSAVAFALECLRRVAGEEVRRRVAQGMIAAV